LLFPILAFCWLRRLCLFRLCLHIHIRVRVRIRRRILWRDDIHLIHLHVCPEIIARSHRHITVLLIFVPVRVDIVVLFLIPHLTLRRFAVETIHAFTIILDLDANVVYVLRLTPVRPGDAGRN
jgi:hypothetical protein